MVSTTHEEQMGLNSPAEPQTGDSKTSKCEDRILLVEDDKPTLRLERVILEEAGYLVEGVDSGEAALEFIAEEPPALVILDIGLPGMDGFTTCQRIRESSQVPVVMVTGSKTAGDQKQGKASGANGYVTKPFLTGKLVDLVGEIIAESTGYTDVAREWAEEDSKPVLIPSSELKTANTPAPSAPVLDVGEPKRQSASLTAGYRAQPDGDPPDGNQPDGNQPIDAALPWYSGESSAPAAEEEPGDNPEEAAFGWNSRYSQEQPSSLEDPDSEDSLPRDGGEPEYPKQHVKQPPPAGAVAFDQEKSSAASSLEEQPPGLGNKNGDDSAFSPPALTVEDLPETAPEDPAAADEPPDEPDCEQYEGTVRLIVSSSGPVKNLLSFVGELRQNTQLRLLRLVANQRSESMDIWLGLREPLQLITILGEIPGVSQVDALPDQGGDEEERRVTVAVGQ